MSKPIRILSAIFASLAVGGINAYDTISKNGLAYQAHPAVAILTDFIGSALVVFIFFFGYEWLVRRKEKKSKLSGDNKFYDEVARELEVKSLRPGLWTRAVAETGNEGSAAKALYIRLRVSELVQQEQTNRANSQAEARRNAAEQKRAAEAAERKARTRAHRIGHKILWIIFILLIAMFGISCLFCFIVPLTEGANSDDLVGSFVAAIILGFITFLCVKGADHCYKEMQ